MIKQGAGYHLYNWDGSCITRRELQNRQDISKGGRASVISGGHQ